MGFSTITDPGASLDLKAALSQYLKNLLHDTNQNESQAAKTRWDGSEFRKMRLKSAMIYCNNCIHAINDFMLLRKR